MNKYFAIYSSSSDYAVRILDSEIKTILVDIYNEQNFELVIKDDYMYMRLWENGLFSNPGLKKDVDDKDVLYKNYKILYVIFYLLTKFEERI